MAKPEEANLRAVAKANPFRPRDASEGGQPAKDGEALYRRGSNGRLHTPSLPGWLGTARVKRSVTEPGRPRFVLGRLSSQTGQQLGAGINNRSPSEDGESDRLIVAGKRLITVEPRGLNVSRPE